MFSILVIGLLKMIIRMHVSHPSPMWILQADYFLPSLNSLHPKAAQPRQSKNLAKEPTELWSSKTYLQYPKMYLTVGPMNLFPWLSQVRTRALGLLSCISSISHTQHLGIHISFLLGKVHTDCFHLGSLFTVVSVNVSSPHTHIPLGAFWTESLKNRCEGT